MSELYGAYRVILTLAARNQSRIDLVENTLVLNGDASPRREVLKRILIVPGKEDNRELIDAEEQGAQLQRQAHLRNPHIIEVYDSGRLNEYFFISMEYVGGQNLEEYLKASGPLSPLKAASIACELCLQAATLHEFQLTLDGKSQAYLHNDIKPSNIQIRTSDNQIRLIDFGAAKSVTYSRNFTRNDFASVAYCSPERLQNGVSDIQSDLWSIAVVLYEMVAGALPFRASSHQQLELLITSGAQPAALPDSCPPDLQAIIYRALSSNVANRYPGASTFAADLQKFCLNPGAASLTPVVGMTDNPTRKVTARPAAATFSPLPAQTGSSRFNSTPASDAGPPVRPTGAAPGPVAAIGAAIRRRPFYYGSRALAAIVVLYVILSGVNAHSGVQKLYSSLLNQDFPSMPVAEIDSQYKELQRLRETKFGRFFAWTSDLRSAIKPRLMETGERPINAFRTSQSRQPLQSDWLRAHSCLTFAAEIDSSDKRARAELYVVDGHLARLAKDYSVARQNFVQASTLTTDSPDPWIGLAWLDAYVDNNLQALISDQIKAQQKHYTPSKREAAQRGDVSMNLGRKALTAAQSWRRKNSVQEETHFLQEADASFVQAEKDYQDCRNWGRTEASIEEIHNRRSTIQQRLAELKRFDYVPGSSK